MRLVWRSTGNSGPSCHLSDVVVLFFVPPLWEAARTPWESTFSASRRTSRGRPTTRASRSVGRAAESAGSSSGLITSEATQRLGELGKLHEQGVLNDDEFAVQKAKILGAA